MNISHTLSTCKHYVYSTIVVLAMTLFLAGCPSPNGPAHSNPDVNDVDDNNNGLIEIHNLDMLRNVHYNLAGTSYNDGSGDPGKTNGGPTSPTDHCSTAVNGVYLCGYELTRNLDFTDEGSYATGIINTDWRPNNADDSNNSTNEGFPGIGSATGSVGGFTGIFEGNGYSISNLYMRTTTATQYYRTGLFRRTDTGAKIRNLGMMNVSIYGGDGRYNYVGGLVGYNFGAIIASYATGDVDGGDGDSDAVGGLVGNNTGVITASYATGTVDDGDGNIDHVGGLVGSNTGGSITASYATGDVYGGDGNNDSVGGLVGYNNGAITASYATGDDVDGGDGFQDRVGGLVGNNYNGTITDSHATGTVDGGDGKIDHVGGLVGYSTGGAITASYATGDGDGGDGNYDNVGGLVGYNNGVDITASYATGDVGGGAGDSDAVGGLVGYNSNGTITDSHATGTVDGGDGNQDFVGGLVGENFGAITASYATGTVDGRDGDYNFVGGLVGYSTGGAITASYATGTVDSGDGNRGLVGGLVGWNNGAITASYATGTVDGGDGFQDRVGGLVGYSNSGTTITASYGFGGATNVGTAGSDGTTKPTLSDGTSITMASQLSQPGSVASKTTAPAGPSWNAADSKTLGAWDFGTSGQNPALKYADYDDAGTTYSCGLFPATIPGTDTLLVCGTTLLPGQRN